MFRTWLNVLEDTTRPLLGPNVKALEFFGILLPENTLKKIMYLILHIGIIVFTASEYADVWFLKSDMNLLLINLKITMLATVTVTKITTVLMWQQKWRDIIEFVTKTDLIHRNSDDACKKEIITKYTKYCRMITYLYWSLTYSTGVTMICMPIFKYMLSPTYRDNVKNGTENFVQVASSWVPFDKNTIPGYLAASAIQTYATIFASGWITTFDSNSMVTMVFFKGQLELIRRDSSKIFGRKNQLEPYEKVMANLKDCQKKHEELVRYARLFDSCLSPIMLLYMFVCSVMLCVTAYQITTETSSVQRLLTMQYLLFGIAQLFMYCWHSNDVLYTSQDLMLGPYESAWWTRDAKLRKDLFILIAQFRKVVVFSAGPFANLTVPTFISIVKGAYSYYTLLSKSQLK